MKKFFHKPNHPDKPFTNNFFSFYQDTVYKLYYYRRYIDYAKRWNNFLNGVVVIFSLSAFSGLWLWEKAPKIWAITVAVAQGLSAIAHLLPFQRQADALSIFLPQLDDFIIQLEKDWYLLSCMSNEEVLDLTSQRKLEYSMIDQKFLGKISFFEKKRFLKYAKKTTHDYNHLHGFSDGEV